MWPLLPLASLIVIAEVLLFSKMRLKVRLMRGWRTFLRTGRLWYQNVLVGEFMRSRLPWASSSFTAAICRELCRPRASLCRKVKSLAAPRDTEAMGQRGSSSLSSSRCSPMWSCPSLYLSRKSDTLSRETIKFHYCLNSAISHLLTRTKLNVCPVVFVTASRMYSKVGVQGQAKCVTPE